MKSLEPINRLSVDISEAVKPLSTVTLDFGTEILGGAAINEATMIGSSLSELGKLYFYYILFFN